LDCRADAFGAITSLFAALEACAEGSLILGNLVKKRSKLRSGHNDADESGFEQRTVNMASARAMVTACTLAARLTQKTKMPESAYCGTAFGRR